MPTFRDWVFSAKAYASALLALYIGLAMNLERPYWAMLTAVLIPQPLTAAMRSKGFYRFCGTLMGSVAAVAMVPNLVGAPELLSLAIALWSALCIYFAVLDRTARSYAFMLAGFTTPVIGFGSVLAPDQIFQTAFTRVEEITIGILCATLIGTIVFPRPLGPALLKKLDGWFDYGRAWSVAVLSGRADTAEIKAARRELAGTAVDIGMMASQLAFDTSLLQTATRPLTYLRERVVALLPVLDAIDDWRGELVAHGGVSADLKALMDRMAAWIADDHDAPRQVGEELRADIGRARTSQAPPATWQDVVRAAILMRLQELTEIVLDARALRRNIGAGNPDLPALTVPQERAPDASRWHDHVIAGLSAMAAVIAILLVCTVWIATAWPSGATAAIIAAVMCTFFAAQDDPTPAIVSFTGFAAAGIAAAAVYLFAIVPHLVDFLGLALAMAPLFLLVGAFLPSPKWGLSAMSFLVNLASMLAFSDTYNADFGDFVNTALAFLAGGGAAAVVTSLVRSVGAEWSARRLRRVTWNAIAAAASQPDAPYRPAMLAGMLDRLSALVPRLAAADAYADSTVTEALRDIRVGLGVVSLREANANLPASERSAVGTALDALARHYRRRDTAVDDNELRTDLEQAIALLTGNSPAGEPRLALINLIGIRHMMFPAAPRVPASAA